MPLMLQNFTLLAARLEVGMVLQKIPSLLDSGLRCQR